MCPEIQCIIYIIAKRLDGFVLDKYRIAGYFRQVLNFVTFVGELNPPKIKPNGKKNRELLFVTCGLSIA